MWIQLESGLHVSGVNAALGYYYDNDSICLPALFKETEIAGRPSVLNNSSYEVSLRN